MSTLPTLTAQQREEIIMTSSLLSTTTLASLSRHRLTLIEDDCSVAEALAVARTHRIHHLPVTHDHELVGIVCTCDLHGAIPDAPVAAIMRTPVIALDRNAHVLDAVSSMNTHDVGSVVLMDGSHACGILTRGDVLMAQPKLAPLFIKSSCNCCGLTRHLAASADGTTLCMFCLEPGADGRLNHIEG
jgi:predicted transcriptional regulator